MVTTLSVMPELGTIAPPISLPNFNSRHAEIAKTVQLKSGSPVLVMFICNHCPFVVLIAEALSKVSNKALASGIQVVAINSNDVDNYPDDSPEKMQQFAEQHGFNFAYVFDESQDIAKAYGAACTPDLFLYDDQHKLVYRGQFDAARPGNNVEPTGADLQAAIDALQAEQAPVAEQTASMGCNIKWKANNAPDYFA
jgi:thiol-disulfide isomerase/thioredoxin